MEPHVEIAMDFFIKMVVKLGLTYTIENFPSGAVMMDVECNDDLIVFQFYDNIMGYSVIDENTGFSTIPDVCFTHPVHFFTEAKKLLGG